MLANKRKAVAHAQGNMWSNLRRPEAYKPLIILNVFFLFQQLTGIYVAVSYTLDFVKDSGVTKDIGFIAVLLGALRLGVIFLGTCCSKTLGRRFTAIVSGVGMTPCLLLLAFDRYQNQIRVQPGKLLYLQKVILYSLLGCASVLSPGMNMGYSAFALTYMRTQLYLSTDQETWIASLSNLVTPIGCLLSGPILERYGRKFTLILVSVPCSIGWFLMAFEPTLTRIYIGRILTGLATGLASTPGSVYAAECTLSTLRGYLMSGSTVFISLGILVVNVLGLVFKDNWQIVAAIGGGVSLVVAFITLIFVPESPVWLVTNGYESRATKSLKTLRGTSRTQVIQKELSAMLANKRKAVAHAQGNMWSNLRRPEAYKPLIILNVFFLFQQLTGIYVVGFLSGVIEGSRFRKLVKATFTLKQREKMAACTGSIFVIIFLPETQGKTLTEIEQYFMGSNARPSGRTDEEVSLNGGANGHAKVPIVRPANRAS
ncbi:facilitated trehalose transporter Tret1-like [Diaphorina citri]|uniref:Facilitated trehalose transporter Tret1-like n=1 Tax=Diaphorina citri TaxID=121845 RepID=A0A3Q0JMG2_DIACI|nr:facilitated trehalose transporter Tret1-like [Diaphorina citri]